MILWILIHAAMAIAFAFVCHGVGALMLRRVPFDDPTLRFAAATALGYGLLGQLVFVLALLHALTRTNVAILFAIAAIAALLGGGWKSVRMTHVPWILIGSLPSLLIAMYPPVGYDGTMYHLVYARLFADAGQLVFADALRFPVFPQLSEMHFTAALLLAGERAMQLTGWLALPVTAIATASIVRQAGGGERAALFAAALWLGTPYSVYLSATAYIDVTLTMFVTLAIACMAPGLSGAFAGLAAATKYHGLFFIAVVARRRKLALSVVAALLFAAPWYAHIARETGNPIFPYLHAIFGDNDYGTRIDARLQFLVTNPLGAAAHLPNEAPFVSIVRHAIVRPIGFGVPPHSPWIVLLLPMVIAGAVLAPRLRKPLLAAAVYALIILTLDWRFMIVIVPLCAAAVGIVVERLIRSTRVVALAFILPGFAWGVLLMAMKYGPMPHTPAQREAFIAQRIHVYRAVRAMGPATVYVMRGQNNAYYCPKKCIGDTHGPYRFELVEPLLNDPPRLAAKLRSFGATHFVVDRTNTRFTPAPPFRLIYSDAKAYAYEMGSDPAYVP